MKLFRVIRLSFYAVFLTGLGIGYYVYSESVSRPLENRAFKLEIPKGVGVSWLGSHLERNGVIDNRYLFRAYIWLNNRDIQIKAGEYTLVDVVDIPDLVNKVENGEVIQYSITLVEGLTFKDYVNQLGSQERLTDELGQMSDRDVMRKLGAPGMHPEGWFAPETYFYQRGDSDFDVLKQAYERMQVVLEDAWNNRDASIKLKNKYELLTMASIIEKETGVAHERPEISGVFNNRLRIGMKLQTDPTVIYGMGDSYDGNIRRRDLTTDTPYNTYTRYGLTPTPIAMPGEASIRAAANPATTEALYFVGKGDGTHYFSKTLREHNNAVIKYQLGGKPRAFSSNPQSGKN